MMQAPRLAQPAHTSLTTSRQDQNDVATKEREGLKRSESSWLCSRDGSSASSETPPQAQCCLAPQATSEAKSASQAELKDIAKNGFQKCFDDLYKPLQKLLLLKSLISKEDVFQWFKW
ncbi:hypothetical protein TNCV_3498011 [Trichonephila clavipes]|nr:hypothetical protein TNCV_3498011 [Trichonephila clavipes]